MPDSLLTQRNLHIWVDADACPVAVKEILFRAAERTRIMTTLVANSPLAYPNQHTEVSPFFITEMLIGFTY